MEFPLAAAVPVGFKPAFSRVQLAGVPPVAVLAPVLWKCGLSGFLGSLVVWRLWLRRSRSAFSGSWLVDMPVDVASRVLVPLHHAAASLTVTATPCLSPPPRGPMPVLPVAKLPFRRWRLQLYDMFLSSDLVPTALGLFGHWPGRNPRLILAAATSAGAVPFLEALPRLTLRAPLQARGKPQIQFLGSDDGGVLLHEGVVLLAYAVSGTRFRVLGHCLSLGCFCWSR